MEKLRIKNNDIYRIEVNDDGEYIEFDLNDIGAKQKLYDALGQIESINKKYQPLILDTKTDKEVTNIEIDMFKEMRKAMDTFLGEGACQKIFGDRNYYEMFNDLTRELSRKRPELKGKSHFDMLNMNAENIRKRIVQKYNKSKDNVL